METIASGANAGSLDTWCYSAVPSNPGKTGVRAFAGDSSGIGQNNSGLTCCTATGIDFGVCVPLR
jgi:hypothetical protein